MGKRRLSKREIKALNEELAPLGIELSKKDAVEILDGQSYVVDGEPWLFRQDDGLVPHLRLLLRRPHLLKAVTVDMGAVKHVVNGADVMRPGVTAVEDGVAEGRLVVIIDETHGKPLAVGRALMDATGMRNATAGKVVATLHWVGDKHWNT